MSRRRSIKIPVASLAAASLVVAACSGDDDDDAITRGHHRGRRAPSQPTRPRAPRPRRRRQPSDRGHRATDTTEATEATTSDAGGRRGRRAARSAAAAAASRTVRTRSRPRRRPVRSAWRGTGPLLVVQQQPQPRQRRRQHQPAVPHERRHGGGSRYYDADLNYINNDQFGTCTIDSLDPLTITYTINEGVTWSDGVQVDAADMLLDWAAQSGVFNDADTVVTEDTGVTAQADAGRAADRRRPRRHRAAVDRCRPTTRRSTPRRAALLEGYTYKEATGVVVRRGQRVAAAGHPVPGDLRGRPVAHGRRGTRSTSTTRRRRVPRRAGPRRRARTRSASRIRPRPRRR